ncbi:DUF4245 family protein [Nocardioides insulae]|uniref:DUF4245 family protein n=1 Tax=Nocardioides insulae TaxID=394734 RepID=UPI00040063CA|nr:DUF4245 family protein [Nocardioides insulae]
MSETESTTTGQEPVGQPRRRYPRTFGGLVAAMIITTAAVLIYWVAQESRKEVPDSRPDPVPYAEWSGLVQAYQDAGLTVVYPSSVPEGWDVTSVRGTAASDFSWGLGLLTEDDAFVGLVQEDEDLEDLLAEHVDEDAEQGEDLVVDGAVARRWSTWTDEGGDHAYASEVGEDTVLVYGSAPTEDLERFLRLLTTDPLED